MYMYALVSGTCKSRFPPTHKFTYRDCCFQKIFEPSHKKINNLDFHPGLYNVPTRLYSHRSGNTGADQLYKYCSADLLLCFHIANCWFSYAAAHMVDCEYCV